MDPVSLQDHPAAIFSNATFMHSFFVQGDRFLKKPEMWLLEIRLKNKNMTGGSKGQGKEGPFCKDGVGF